jgi:hypothetical protein
MERFVKLYMKKSKEAGKDEIEQDSKCEEKTKKTKCEVCHLSPGKQKAALYRIGRS